MITIDAQDTRLNQAQQIVKAAKELAHRNNPGSAQAEFESIVADLLQSALDNEWVDEELESNIRSNWAALVQASVVNDLDNDDLNIDNDDLDNEDDD